MSTNIRQTRIKKDRLPFLIAFATAFALLASFLMGWLAPVNSSASLSNGGFCIESAYDSDPEIEGMAGNCKPETGTPVSYVHCDSADWNSYSSLWARAAAGEIMGGDLDFLDDAFRDRVAAFVVVEFADADCTPIDVVGVKLVSEQTGESFSSVFEGRQKMAYFENLPAGSYRIESPRPVLSSPESMRLVLDEDALFSISLGSFVGSEKLVLG